MSTVIFRADGEIGAFAALQAKFAQTLAGFDARLGIVAGHRLGDARGPPIPEGDLNRAVAVSLRRLDLADPVRLHLDNGDSNAVSVLAEQPGHAGLTPNQSDRHGFVLSST
jgi:hypothetical protein